MNKGTVGSVVGIGILVLFALTCIGLQSPYTGTHSGYVTATESGGLIWQTKSAYVKTDVSSTQENRYCVTSEILFNQLETYQKEQKRVTLYFSNGLFVFPWQCGDTESIIVRVEESP